MHRICSDWNDNRENPAFRPMSAAARKRGPLAASFPRGEFLQLRGGGKCENVGALAVPLTPVRDGIDELKSSGGISPAPRAELSSFSSERLFLRVREIRGRFLLPSTLDSQRGD